MTFKFTSDVFGQYIGGLGAVMREGWVDFKSDSIYSFGLNSSNTAMVESTTPIVIEGEPARIALDIAKMTDVITGSVTVMYDGVFNIKVGKTKYKIIPFAPGAVRESKRPDVKLIHRIDGVDVKDVYDALKSIENYDKGQVYYKCAFEFEDGNLIIKDYAENVSTEIGYNEAEDVPSFMIKFSSDVVMNGIMHMKKYMKTISLSIRNDDSPFMISSETDNLSYLIAPRVDVD